jgi:hypothetical protein
MRSRCATADGLRLAIPVEVHGGVADGLTGLDPLRRLVLPDLPPTRPGRR